MVQVTPSETPVSINLGHNESTTVPSGEVWRVTLSQAADSRYQGRLSINGSAASNNHVDKTPSNSFTTTVVGGDTISTNGNAGAHIGGFKVDSTVDNTAVSISLGTSSSTTVPSGETWQVTIAHGTVNSYQGRVLINNDVIMNGHVDKTKSNATTTVVTGGDTIETNGKTEAHIGGWKI